MKRDMDLVRNILFAVESASEPLNTDFLIIEGHTSEEIIYHSFGAVTIWLVVKPN